MASKVNILQNQKVMQPMDASHVADISTTYVNFSIKVEDEWTDPPTEVSLDKLFVKVGEEKYKPVKSYKDFVEAYEAGKLCFGADIPKQILKHDGESVRIFDKDGMDITSTEIAYTKALSIPNTHTATESIGPDSIPYGLQRTAEMKQISTSAADHYLLLQLAGSDKWTYYKKSDIYYFDDSNNIQFISSLNLKDPADIAKFQNRRLFAKSGDKSFEIGKIYTEHEYEFSKYTAFEDFSADNNKLSYQVLPDQAKAATDYAAEASLPDDKKTIVKVRKMGVDVYCALPKTEVLDPYYVEYTPKKIKVNDPANPGETKEKYYYSAKMYQKSETGEYVCIRIKGEEKPRIVHIGDLYETESSSESIQPFLLSYYCGKAVKVKIGSDFVDTEVLTYEEVAFRYAKRRTFQKPVNAEDDVVSDKSYRQLKNGEYFKEKDLEPICLRQTTGSEVPEAWLVTYEKDGNLVTKVFGVKEDAENFVTSNPTLTDLKSYGMVYCAYRDCSVIQTTSAGAKGEDCVVVGDIKDAGVDEPYIKKPEDPTIKSNAKDKALADYAAGKYEIDFTFEVDKNNFVPICYNFAYGSDSFDAYLVRFVNGTDVKEMVISKKQLDAKGGTDAYSHDTRYSFHPLYRTNNYDKADVVQTATTGSELEHIQIFCEFSSGKYDNSTRIVGEADEKAKLKEKLVKGFKDGTYVIPEDEKVPYIKREMASNKRYIYTDETYLEDYEADKGPYRGFNDHTVELTEKDGKYDLKSTEKEFSIKKQLGKDFAILGSLFLGTFGVMCTGVGILAALISPWLVAAPFIGMVGAAIVLPIKAIIQKVWHQFKDKLAADRNQWGKDATKKLENLNEYVNEKSYDLGTILTKIEDSKNEILALSKGTPTEIPEIVDGKIKVDKNNARFVQNFKKLYKAECDELDNLNKQIEKLEKYLKKKYGDNYRTNSKTPVDKIAELDALIADRDKIVAKLDGYLKSYKEKGEVYDTDPLRDEKLKQAQDLKTFAILKLYANDKLNNDDLKNALNDLSLDISILKKLTYDSNKKQYIYVDNKIKVVFDAETGDLITNSKKVPATISTLNIKNLILKINSDVKPIADKVALNEEGKVVYVTDGTSASAEFAVEATETVTYEVVAGEVLEAPVAEAVVEESAEEDAEETPVSDERDRKKSKADKLKELTESYGVTAKSRMSAKTGRLSRTKNNLILLCSKIRRLIELAKEVKSGKELSDEEKKEFNALKFFVHENYSMILYIINHREKGDPDWVTDELFDLTNKAHSRLKVELAAIGIVVKADGRFEVPDNLEDHIGL